MKQEEVTHISELIKSVIQVTVNGKIDAMRHSFDDYIEIDKAWKEEDKKWKDSVEPIKLAYTNTNWLWNLFIKTLKFFGVLGGAAAAIYFLKSKIG